MFTNLLTVTFLAQTLFFPLAITEAEHKMGMMYRTHWGKWAGMVFVFERPSRVGFWMKNTYLPMLIVYTDKNLRILETHEGVPLSTTVLFSRHTNVKYVLELNPAYTNMILTRYEEFRRAIRRELRRRNL